MRKSLRVLAACVVAGVMVLAVPGMSSAASGFHQASKAESKRLLAALRQTFPDAGVGSGSWKTLPVECMNAKQANSSRNWYSLSIYLESPGGRDCREWAADVQWLFTIMKGGRAVQVAASSALNFNKCSWMEEQIVRVHKAPRSVYRDVRAAGYCSP